MAQDKNNQGAKNPDEESEDFSLPPTPGHNTQPHGLNQHHPVLLPSFFQYPMMPHVQLDFSTPPPHHPNNPPAYDSPQQASYYHSSVTLPQNQTGVPYASFNNPDFYTPPHQVRNVAPYFGHGASIPLAQPSYPQATNSSFTHESFQPPSYSSYSHPMAQHSYPSQEQIISELRAENHELRAENNKLKAENRTFKQALETAKQQTSQLLETLENPEQKPHHGKRKDTTDHHTHHSSSTHAGSHHSTKKKKDESPENSPDTHLHHSHHQKKHRTREH